jgi:hypothetical protein
VRIAPNRGDLADEFAGAYPTSTELGPLVVQSLGIWRAAPMALANAEAKARRARAWESMMWTSDLAQVVVAGWTQAPTPALKLLYRFSGQKRTSA